ncbi:MAG: amino acid ABC transporter substrate-binding protein [Roseinatronobacter sp.]
MRKLLIASLLLGQLPDTGQAASLLDTVQDRGVLICGTHNGRTGLGAPDASGVWQGFDIGFCRAVAAAVLGDPGALQIVPLSAQDQFTALLAGHVDLLARSATWTFSRDAGQDLTFVGISYFDTQGIMVRRSTGAQGLSDLEAAPVCVELGTVTEPAIAEAFMAEGLVYEPILVATGAEAAQNYLSGVCDAYAGDQATLASARATFAEPAEHVILPDPLSKRPSGPVVRAGDNRWADVVRWTLFALIAAEDLGVTSANIQEMQTGRALPEVNRLLGHEDDFGKMLGLDPHWAARAIASVGNYGELFASTLGEQTPLGLRRGLNAQKSQGGLLFAPPFR